MFPVGFEPTISAGERPQPYALDRAATGTDPKGLHLAKMRMQILVTVEIRDCDRPFQQIFKAKLHF